jgi:hypothetical protein
LTINQATSTTGVSVAGGENFTYDGNAHPATVSVTGAGGLNLTPAPVYSCGHAPLDVADSGCTASYTYAGDANHTGSSDSKTYTIGKADPVVVATGGTFTYDGSAHAGSAIATGVNSEPLTPVTVAYSVPPPGVGNLTGAPTNTGSYLVAARFAGNVNYNQKQSAAVALTIEQASSTTAVTCPAGPYTYNGAAQTPCSVAVTGAGGLNLTPAATYSNNVNAGTATASYTFAGDANHAGSSNSKTFTIDTAAATISVVGFSGVYDGNAHGVVSSSATGVNNESLTGLAFDATTYTNVPGGLVHWTFTNANYADQSGDATVAITQTGSTTTVTCPPGPHTYTGIAQTPCSAVATGAGVLNTSVTVTHGSNTNAGTATADASFAGDVNHSGSTATQKTFTIDQASSATTITCPASVTFNGSAQTPCSAAATGAGGLSTSVTVNHGNNTNVGTATADATYAGDANHKGSTAAEITFAIDLASSTTAVTVNDATYDGSSHGGTATVTGVGGLSQSLTVTYVGRNGTVYPSTTTAPTNAGDYTASASFSGDTNHGGSSDSRPFTIGKANATVTVNGYTGTYNGAAHGASGSANGVGGANLNAGLSLGATFTNAPGGTAQWNFSGGMNYKDRSGNVAIVINKANPTITVANYIVPFDGSSHSATGTAKGVVGETLAGLDLSGTTHTSVGTFADSWSFVDSTGNYNLASGSSNDQITAWKDTGFYSPVNMPAGSTIVWNVIKGGSTVPMKFNLYATAGGSEITSTTAVQGGSIAVYNASCGAGIYSDDTSVLTNTGATSLRYDTTGGQFIQNWQSPKAPGKCYAAVMTSSDGTSLVAYFQTK